ncbi:MAG: hypothetical protein Q9179_007798 [Wetmoreana sp. 5 TL-2023]
MRFGRGYLLGSSVAGRRVTPPIRLPRPTLISSISDKKSSSRPEEGLTRREDWFYQSIHLPLPTRAIFEEYSGLLPDEVERHIQDISNYHQRHRAFKVYPYPCLGQNRFLNLSLSRHPQYPEVLARLSRSRNALPASQPGESLEPKKPPELFLDLGCCLGQDIRKLVVDGAASENLYGLDIEPHFIDLGYELFRDRRTLKSRFTIADLLTSEGVENAGWDKSQSSTVVDNSPSAKDVSSDAATPSPACIPLSTLKHQISIIAANSFFHIHNLASQFTLATQAAHLLVPRPGSLILGRQVGSLKPGEYTSVDSTKTRFAHDVTSFQQFWDRVADNVGGGCRFHVEATLDENELGENKNQGQEWAEPDIRRLIFAVRRV